MTDTLQRPMHTEDRVHAILAAAEIVMDRFGHEKLSLSQIARVSLIPLARIYQHFPDRNAVLGALSTGALERLCGSIDTRGTWSPDLDETQRLDRVIDRFAGFLDAPSTAYLVLCSPFDEASEQARRDGVHRLATSLRHAVGSSATEPGRFRSDDALEYAAELVFACFRRSYLIEGRISATAIEMAQHAVSSFAAV